MGSLGGVTYIFTSTGVNFHPIAKPFEMGTYLSIIKRPFFLYDHRMCKNSDFGPFLEKFWQIFGFSVNNLLYYPREDQELVMNSPFTQDFCFFPHFYTQISSFLSK